MGELGKPQGYQSYVRAGVGPFEDTYRLGIDMFAGVIGGDQLSTEDQTLWTKRLT